MWSNERENPTLVRLDRAFCNADWELLFPNYSPHAQSTGASYQTPIMLTKQETMPRRATFRFEDHWLKIDGFNEVVAQAYAKPQSGSTLFVLQKNC